MSGTKPSSVNRPPSISLITPDTELAETSTKKKEKGKETLDTHGLGAAPKLSEMGESSTMRRRGALPRESLTSIEAAPRSVGSDVVVHTSSLGEVPHVPLPGEPDRPVAPAGGWNTIMVGNRSMQVPHSAEQGNHLADQLFGPANNRPTPWQAQSVSRLKKLTVPAGRDPIDFYMRHIASSLVNSANVLDLDRVVRNNTRILHAEGFTTPQALFQLLSEVPVLDHLTEYGHGFFSALGFGVAAGMLDFEPGSKLAESIGNSLPNKPGPVALSAAAGGVSLTIGSMMDHSPGRAVATGFADSYYMRPANDRLPPSLVAAQQPNRWLAALSTGFGAIAGYGVARNGIRIAAAAGMLTAGVSLETRQLVDSVIDAVGGPTIAGPALRMTVNALERIRGNSGAQFFLGADDLQDKLQAYKGFKQNMLKTMATSTGERIATIFNEFKKTPFIESEVFTADAWISHGILGSAGVALGATGAALADKPGWAIAAKHAELWGAYFPWGFFLTLHGTPKQPKIEQLAFPADGGDGSGHLRIQPPQPGLTGSAWAAPAGVPPGFIETTVDTEEGSSTGGGRTHPRSHASFEDGGSRSRVSPSVSGGHSPEREALETGSRDSAEGPRRYRGHTRGGSWASTAGALPATLTVASSTTRRPRSLINMPPPESGDLSAKKGEKAPVVVHQPDKGEASTSGKVESGETPPTSPKSPLLSPDWTADPAAATRRRARSLSAESRTPSSDQLAELAALAAKAKQASTSKAEAAPTEEAAVPPTLGPELTVSVTHDDAPLTEPSDPVRTDEAAVTTRAQTPPAEASSKKDPAPADTEASDKDKKA